MKRCLLLLLAIIITGCSQANMRGNETVRHYNITINNDNQSLLVVDMPLQVDAITSEKTDMTADNDPATDVSTPISLAAQGATASTAAKDATQELSELVSDYKLWNDFRKWKSDNDNSNNPEPEPTTPPEVIPPEVTPPVTPPVDPEKPSDMFGYTDYMTIPYAGEKMSYNSVWQDKFVFTELYGPDFGPTMMVAWSDGNTLKVPNTSTMAMQGESGGFRKFQPGGTYSYNPPDPSIPYMEVYAARGTHPDAVTVFYNGEGTKVGPNKPVPVNPPVTSPIDLSSVEWLHTDVSGWPVTGDLQSVSTTSSTISLPYDKAKVWPTVKISDNLLNANPWVFIKQDGKWYAATWEWLRPGQTSKSKSAVAGDHIKQAPLKDWKPVVGETYGFMVSGLARHSERNVEERTNIVMYEWR